MLKLYLYGYQHGIRSSRVNCKGCSVCNCCMGERARLIQRWEYQELIDRHKERIKECGKIVGHLFGTLKNR